MGEAIATGLRTPGQGLNGWRLKCATRTVDHVIAPGSPPPPKCIPAPPPPMHWRTPPPPLCDIPSGCCSFTGPWTVTRSSLRMLRRVAALCRPLQPVLLLVSFPRSRSPPPPPPEGLLCGRADGVGRNAGNRTEGHVNARRIAWEVASFRDCGHCNGSPQTCGALGATAARHSGELFPGPWPQWVRFCFRIPVFFGWGQGAGSLSSLVHPGPWGQGGGGG